MVILGPVGFPTKGIGHYVCLSRVVMNFQIIIFDQFQPSSLSQVKVWLGEDILQTFMVGKDFTLISNQIMPPNLKCVHYGCEFQIMGRVVLLMSPELTGSICNDFPILHQYTTQSLSGRITIDDKIPMNIRQG